MTLHQKLLVIAFAAGVFGSGYWYGQRERVEQGVPSTVSIERIVPESSVTSAPEATGSATNEKLLAPSGDVNVGVRLPQSSKQLLSELGSHERSQLVRANEMLGGAYSFENVEQYRWLLSNGYPPYEFLLEHMGSTSDSLISLALSPSGMQAPNAGWLKVVALLRGLEELKSIPDMEARKRAYLENKVMTVHGMLLYTSKPALLGRLLMAVDAVVPNAGPENLHVAGNILARLGGDTRTNKPEAYSEKDHPVSATLLSLNPYLDQRQMLCSGTAFPE